MGYGEFSSPTIAMSVLILYAVDLLYRTSKEEKSPILRISDGVPGNAWSASLFALFCTDTEQGILLF